MPTFGIERLSIEEYTLSSFMTDILHKDSSVRL